MWVSTNITGHSRKSLCPHSADAGSLAPGQFTQFLVFSGDHNFLESIEIKCRLRTGAII